jgi:hypothetical protein
MKENFVRKKNCIVFSLIFFAILFLKASFALDVQVVKTAPGSIKFGDILDVSITINNLENSGIPVTIKEYIANADPIQPQSFYIEECPTGFCVKPPYYSWNTTLQPKSIYTISYKIKPLSFGNFDIPPTEVQASSGDRIYSNSLTVVVRCESNGICEPNSGENYFTCLEDCPSGSKDNVCDLIKDGRCDSDCTPGADTDCLEATTTTTTVPVGKPSGTIYIYLVVIGIIVAVIVFFLYRIKVARE